MKQELIYTRTFESCAGARLALFDYLEVFYNRKTPPLALGYLSPVDYERAAEEKRQAA